MKLDKYITFIFIDSKKKMTLIDEREPLNYIIMKCRFDKCCNEKKSVIKHKNKNIIVNEAKIILNILYVLKSKNT